MNITCTKPNNLVTAKWYGCRHTTCELEKIEKKFGYHAKKSRENLSIEQTKHFTTYIDRTSD